MRRFGFKNRNSEGFFPGEVVESTCTFWDKLGSDEKGYISALQLEALSACQ
jgi:hypothetical protein